MAPESTTAGRPDLSVVVPVLDGGDDLRRCLDSIEVAREGLSIELLVVDDGSRDESGRLAAERGARVIRVADGPRGPAYARNRGAEVARSELLFFTDADCIVSPEALHRAVETLRAARAPAAVIGSYDDAPLHPAFLSRFKNLFHHWVHQGGNGEARTFWTGCGAIRREVFVAAGGFNEGYAKPSIEDIELGARLGARGHRIRLDKGMVVKHAKRWRFVDLVRTDVLRRGAPWIALMLRQRETPRDLNLSLDTRVATLAAGLFVLSVPILAALGHVSAVLPALGLLAGATATTWLCGTVDRAGVLRTAAGLALVLLPTVAATWLWPDPWAMLPMALLFTTVYCHIGLFWLFTRRYGWLFSVSAVPMHFAHLLCCIASVPLGLLQHQRDLRELRLRGTGPALRELPSLGLNHASVAAEGVGA